MLNSFVEMFEMHFLIARLLWVGATCFWLVLPQCSGQPQLSESLRKAEEARVKVIEQCAPSVLSVYALNGGGGGSGVIISEDGYALTNYHVVRSMGYALRCGLGDGRVLPAVLVGLDPTGDVALIKLLHSEPLPFSVMGDSDHLQTGDWCMAMGNPFLLATDHRPTVTFGIVSGLHRYQYPSGSILEYTDCIQVDTSINPGNSGGPLFSMDGKLVGINGRGSFEKRGRVNVGVGYAISINQIKNFLGSLKSGRLVDHSSFGATVRDGQQGQVIVTDIASDSHAYTLGIRPGDEILSVAGRATTSANQFKNILGVLPEGWRVRCEIRSNGNLRTASVQLQSAHGVGQLAAVVARTSRAGRRRRDDSIPREIQDRYKSRPGFANAYFNQLELQRVLDSVLSPELETLRQQDWKLTGYAEDLDLQISVASNRVGIKIAGSETVINLQTPEIHRLTGIATALHLWRVTVSEATKESAEFIYVGTAPWHSQDELCDVIHYQSKFSAGFVYVDTHGSMVAIDARTKKNERLGLLEFVDIESQGSATREIKWRDSSGEVADWRIETAEPMR